MVAVQRNAQLVTNTGGIVENITFVSDYKSKHQVSTVHADITIDDEHTT